MAALVHTNPPGTVKPYMNLYSNVTICPPGARLAYISSQYSSDENGEFIDGSYFEQCKKTMENVMAILKALGCTLENVVSRRPAYLEFNEEIGKESVEGSIAGAGGPQFAEALLKSSCAYQGFSHFHKPGVKFMVRYGPVCLPSFIFSRMQHFPVLS
jgi:hypothetical protein